MLTSINSIQLNYQSLSEKIKQFIPYGLPIKLILGSVLGVLGGAGFLGLLSDYATYYYAYDMGFRPPLEGVPYLKVAVSFSSIFLLLSGAVIFSISLIIFKILYFTIFKFITFSGKSIFDLTIKIFDFIYANKIPKRLPRHDKTKIYFILNTASKINSSTGFFPNMEKTLLIGQKFSPAIKIAMCLAFSSFTIILIFLITHFTPKNDARPEITIRITFVFAYFFIISLILLFPKARWPFSFVVTFFYFSFCIYSLFQTNWYGQFLMKSGYGGGIPAILHCKDKLLDDRLATAKTSIMLRTNDTYVLYSQREHIFIEIPTNEIIYLSYSADGLANLINHKFNVEEK